MKGDTQVALVSNLPPAVVARLDEVKSRFSYAQPFVVSELHFARNNIDAVVAIQHFLSVSGLHDYAGQGRTEVPTAYVGALAGEIVERPFVLPFYRSGSIRNDPRFSIHAPILRLTQVGDCLVFAQRGDGSLVILNLTRDLPSDSLGGGRWLFLLRTAGGFDVAYPVEAVRGASVRSQGRLQDSVLRRQIEEYAVGAAIDFYASSGASDIQEVGKPYDLSMKLGGEERRVEVKGSTNLVDRVIVTANEVDHARDFDSIDLIIVDGISRTRVGKEWQLSGGRLRRWTEWAPADWTLRPLTFEHTVEPHGIADVLAVGDM